MAALFRKARTGAPRGFFACEAAGLRWLALAPGGAPVVDVLDVGDDHLDLARLDPVPPTPEDARTFGARLARLHLTGARSWGSAPDGWAADGFFGPLDDPIPLATGSWPTWGAFAADARLRPVAEQGAGRGTLEPTEQDALRRLADRLETLPDPPDGPGSAPDRVHGDLWSGNVLWTARGGVLIDPAAHGGDGEADLAMLALFGAPHLDAIVAGYDAVRPPRPGRARRVRLHQVYPVAVHAVLFGGGYHAHLAQLVDVLLDDR